MHSTKNPPKNWSVFMLDKMAAEVSGTTGSFTQSRAALVALFGAPSK